MKGAVLTRVTLLRTLVLEPHEITCICVTFVKRVEKAKDDRQFGCAMWLQFCGVESVANKPTWVECSEQRTGFKEGGIVLMWVGQHRHIAGTQNTIRLVC